MIGGGGGLRVTGRETVLIIFMLGLWALSSLTFTITYTSTYTKCLLDAPPQQAKNGNNDDNYNKNVHKKNDNGNGTETTAPVVAAVAAATRETASIGTTTTTNISINNNNNNKMDKEEEEDDGVLRPPYRIVQFGPGRSASTFQHHLLEVLVKLKSRPPNDQHTLLFTYATDTKVILNSVRLNKSFVIKNHIFNNDQFSLLLDHGVTLFASSYGENSGLPQETIDKDYMLSSDPTISNKTIQDAVVYTQRKANVQQCSLCEIENYRKPFNLTDEEVTIARSYMSNWEKIRQCCGVQSSKYHMLYIHGCNMTKYGYDQVPGYPMCEHYNMTQVELDLVSSPIYINNNPNSKPNNRSWTEPGDCARLDDLMVREKVGFNFRRFQGCDLGDRLAA